MKFILPKMKSSFFVFLFLLLFTSITYSQNKDSFTQKKDLINPNSVDFNPILFISEDLKKDNQTIDLLAIYTTKVKNHKGDRTKIESYIKDQIKLTNQILANSGLAHRRIRLVGMEEVDYTQTDSFFLDLANLSDETHELGYHTKKWRLHYKADLVHLFVPEQTHELCGLTHMLWLDSRENTKAYLESECTFHAHPTNCKKDILTFWQMWSRSFSMSTTNCNDLYAFTHELGHSMGLYHDHYTQNMARPYTDHLYTPQNQNDDPFYRDLLDDPLYKPYGAGHIYQNVEESKCLLSIMSYPYECWKMDKDTLIERIPFFSGLNPIMIGERKEYLFGVYNKTDASRAIDENWDVIAGFSDMFSSTYDNIINNFPFID